MKKTYNTSSEDIKQFVTKFDEAINEYHSIEERIEASLWINSELTKMIYYLAKRVDDLQGIKHN